MRSEMLKRLDQVMAYVTTKIVEEWGPFDDESPGAIIAGWKSLREELASELCENCHVEDKSELDSLKVAFDDLQDRYDNLKRADMYDNVKRWVDPGGDS